MWVGITNDQQLTTNDDINHTIFRNETTLLSLRERGQIPHQSKAWYGTSADLRGWNSERRKLRLPRELAPYGVQCVLYGLEHGRHFARAHRGCVSRRGLGRYRERRVAKVMSNSYVRRRRIVIVCIKTNRILTACYCPS